MMKTTSILLGAALLLAGQSAFAQDTSQMRPELLAAIEQDRVASENCNLPAWICRPEMFGGERIGDWVIRRETDAMDVNQLVTIATAGRAKDDRQYGDAEIAFEMSIWDGGSLITMRTGFRYGDESWPYCTQNTARVSVDGGAPRYINTIERGGSCDAVSPAGTAIREMKAGRDATLRIAAKVGYNDDYQLSLVGFTAAFNKAIAMSRVRPRR